MTPEKNLGGRPFLGELGRTEVIRTRLTTREREAAQTAAAIREVTLSAYIRELLLDAIREEGLKI